MDCSTKNQTWMPVEGKWRKVRSREAPYKLTLGGVKEKERRRENLTGGTRVNKNV